MINKRRRYDVEFKGDAVKLLISGGRNAKDVAEELGVPLSVVGRWRREYLEELDTKAGGKGDLATEMEKEIQRLRKELAHAHEQRDILKKACGILSGTPERGMP